MSIKIVPSVFLLIAFFISIVGCNKKGIDESNVNNETTQQNENDGSWIIIHYSGGIILDVWKIKNNEQKPDYYQNSQWVKFYSGGNCIRLLASDVKIINVGNSDFSIWNSYKEYHSELTTKSYIEYVQSTASIETNQN